MLLFHMDVVRTAYRQTLHPKHKHSDGLSNFPEGSMNAEDDPCCEQPKTTSKYEPLDKDRKLLERNV
jgi:hypothetical protein